MPTTLTVYDKSASGEVYSEMTLEFPAEEISIRELVESRVYQEVKDFNADRAERFFSGLIQPIGSEIETSGFRVSRRKGRQIDWRPQFEKACEAFQNNQLLILVDDKQASSLDEIFSIKPETRIVFLKLVVLIGG